MNAELESYIKAKMKELNKRIAEAGKNRMLIEDRDTYFFIEGQIEMLKTLLSHGQSNQIYLGD